MDYYKDFAHCVTTGSINDSVTSIPVDETGRIPTGAILTKSEFFMTLIDSTVPTAPVFEIVQVTAKSTSSGAGNLTVVRARGGSAASSFPSAAVMKSALFKDELLRVRAFLSGSGAAPTYDSDLHTQGDPYARLNTDGSVDLFVLDGTGAWREVGFPGRMTTTKTSSSLADLASQETTISLPKGYRLYRIETDTPARVRIYTTAAKQTADLARITGVDPTGDHGVMLDFITYGAATPVLSADLSPTVDGFDGAVSPNGLVPITITNLSGVTDTVLVTLSYSRTL